LFTPLPTRLIGFGVVVQPTISIAGGAGAATTLRTYLWLESFDYVIVLEKRNLRIGIIAFLITAYHVDGAWIRSQLLKKYANRVM